jgi:hypothetical protein
MFEFIIGWIVIGFFASLWHIDMVNEWHGPDQIPEHFFMWVSSLCVILCFPMVFITLFTFSKD